MIGPGNLADVLRFFPTQAFNFAFKDTIKAAFKTPKNAPPSLKLATNIASGGAAGTISLLLVYPLDYARTRLELTHVSVTKATSQFLTLQGDPRL